MNLLLLFLYFFILALFLVNDPQALYVNPGFHKCIIDVNLSAAIENLLTVSLILYLALTS